MCISKKAVKNNPMPQAAEQPTNNRANMMGNTGTPNQNLAENQPEKNSLTVAEKNAISNALAGMETQITQEGTTEALEEISPKEPELGLKLKTKKKPKTEAIQENDKVVEKKKGDEEEEKKKKKKVKEKEKEKDKKKKKDSKKMLPVATSGSNVARSPVRNKKGGKSKSGLQNPDDLSINNDKTEFLENAQLTKLMSHADVKALMGGQMAHGADADENSCRDTVEEVDSEMQDIAFSPLLAGIVREDEKPLGALPNPQEQKKETTGS